MGIGPRESMTEFSFCFERETKLINRLQLAIQKYKKYTMAHYVGFSYT